MKVSELIERLFRRHSTTITVDENTVWAEPVDITTYNEYVILTKDGLIFSDYVSRNAHNNELTMKERST